MLLGHFYVFMFRSLGQGYKEVAKSLFNKRPGTGKSANRKSHSEYQDKINGLYSNIKLFEKGIKYFDGKLGLSLTS